MPRLSKSRFIAGWQCPLRLWYAVHRPQWATPPDAGLQAVFDRGHAVGELAQARYPRGVAVQAGHRQRQEALAQSRALMADPAVPAVYEAAIEHDGVLTRVDVLARNGDRWDLIEVKSSTRAKEVFQLDVAVQYWILAGAGVPVREAGLLLLDRRYVYPGGEHDLDALFRFEPLTEFCEAQADWVSGRVAEFHRVAESPAPPEIGIGDHCFSPYECPFFAHCSRDVVPLENPVTDLPALKGGRRSGLEQLGIETIDAIPDDYPLTELQERVRRATVTGEPWIHPGLADALEDVAWPLYFLDFEAAQTAVPRYPGTSPYDAVVFQFSCHRQDAPGAEPDHTGFLATDGSDPRRPLAVALLEAVGTEGAIVVYSSYERRVINDLIQALPDLAEPLAAVRERLWDLLPVLRDHYYHPDFRGSYSIKRVLPALVPGLGYDDLAVADGQAAANAWLRMVESADWVEQAELEDALRAYCHLDTLAMVRLREALLREAESG